MEPGTGAKYPADITFAQGGTRYRLSATGITVRTKFWFKIYSIAHYLEDGPKATQAEVLTSIMSDDTAKQVILEFARDLRADQVLAGFIESYAQRASAEDMRKTDAALQEFLRSIHKDVVKYDRFVVRWLPDGRLVSMYNGKVVSDVYDPMFARIFWSIWFGEDPIVDRDQLIRRRVRGSERSQVTGWFAAPADFDGSSSR